MAKRGSRIRDSVGHRDGFVLRLESGGFVGNSHGRMCDRKGLRRICSLKGFLRNKLGMFLSLKMERII